MHPGGWVRNGLNRGWFGHLFGRAHCDGGFLDANAIDEVLRFAIDDLLDQTMNIGIEAWEFLVEHSSEPEVFDNRLVESFARDQEGDARRVGGQQDRGGPSFEVIDLNAIDFVVGHHRKGIRRFHRWLHRGQVHFGGDAGYVMSFVGIVNPLAQFLQADPFVLRIVLHELGQDLPHRLVLVVVVLELLQRADERVPTSFGDADRKHDEERVQSRLFDDNTVLGQIAGDNRCGNAGLGESTGDIESRGDDGGFDRVEHIEAIGQAAETVPIFVGPQNPIAPFADSFLGQVFGSPDLEPPIRAPFVIDFPHRASEVEGFHDRFLDQGSSAGRFHHRRSHVARSDDGVLRRGR